MTLPQATKGSQYLEERITNLEQELAQMKQAFAVLQQQSLWWRQIAGSCKDDPTFDEATRLAQGWRQSAE